MKNRLSLTQDGVEMVAYPDALKHNVVLAAKAWSAFTMLPDGIKQQFTAASLQSGVGYEKKGDGSRESRDIKENFDITQDSLQELLGQSTIDETATDFITSSSALFDSLQAMITTFGQKVETAYNVEEFSDAATRSASNAFIRFLYYPPVPEGTVVGEPHVDHSGFTFHLYESTDGCERLSLDGKTWLSMPVEAGSAAAFCSMQSQLLSNNILTGLCHRVIANQTTATMGRTAIVCFIPLIDMPPYDRKTHGRLQDKVPGFNYAMPPKEFSRYFRTIR